MNILADTHILIWAIRDDVKLTDECRKILLNPDNEIYYSIVNIWEIAIKHAAHPDKMSYTAETFENLCRQAGYIALDGTMEHVLMLETLKRPEDAPKHRDPFDKFLLAQAKSEGMSFLTHDSLIPYYNEPCIIKV